MIYCETPRLILRNFRPGDVQDYYAYMSLPYTALHESFEPYTLAECEAAVLSRLTDDAFWACELKAEQRLIGDLSFDMGDYNTWEIAYDFNVAYAKKGYATEACRALIAHIFTVHGAHRLYAGCNEANENSWRLLERLGFRREAHAMEDFPCGHDADGNPLYTNSYYYALLRREWEAARATGGT